MQLSANKLFACCMALLFVIGYLTLPKIMDSLWALNIEDVEEYPERWQIISLGNILTFEIVRMYGYGESHQGYECRYTLQCDRNKLLAFLEANDFEKGSYDEWEHRFKNIGPHRNRLDTNWGNLSKSGHLLYCKTFPDDSRTAVLFADQSASVYSIGASAPRRLDDK